MEELRKYFVAHPDIIINQTGGLHNVKSNMRKVKLFIDGAVGLLAKLDVLSNE